MLSLTRSASRLSLLGLAGLLVVLATSCEESDSRTIAGASNPEAAYAIPALRLSDLPPELALTAEQSRELDAALGALAQTRQERVRAHGDRRERRDEPGRWGARRDSAEPPMMTFVEEASRILTPEQFQLLATTLVKRRAELRPELPGIGARLGGRGMGFRGARLGLNDAQQAAVREIVRTHADQLRDVMQSFGDGRLSLEAARARVKAIREDGKNAAKAVLSAEQFTELEALRDGRRRDQVDQRMDRLGDSLGRRADFLGRVLGLTEDQTAQVRAVLDGTIAARRQLLGDLKAGTLEPEDMALEIAQIEKEAAARIEPLLTPEQTIRWKALEALLPRGLR